MTSSPSIINISSNLLHVTISLYSSKMYPGSMTSVLSNIENSLVYLLMERSTCPLIILFLLLFKFLTVDVIQSSILFSIVFNFNFIFFQRTQSLFIFVCNFNISVVRLDCDFPNHSTGSSRNK